MCVYANMYHLLQARVQLWPFGFSQNLHVYVAEYCNPRISALIGGCQGDIFCQHTAVFAK